MPMVALKVNLYAISQDHLVIWLRNAVSDGKMIVRNALVPAVIA